MEEKMDKRHTMYVGKIDPQTFTLSRDLKNKNK